MLSHSGLSEKTNVKNVRVLFCWDVGALNKMAIVLPDVFFYFCEKYFPQLFFSYSACFCGFRSKTKWRMKHSSSPIRAENQSGKMLLANEQFWIFPGLLVFFFLMCFGVCTHLHRQSGGEGCGLTEEISCTSFGMQTRGPRMETRTCCCERWEKALGMGVDGITQ